MRSWLLISAVVITLDIITKQWIQSVLTYGEHVTVTPFFDLVLFYNKGAAFSFLADAGGWQTAMFSAFALLASGLLLYLLRKHANEPLFCFALSLVLGGALGNLLDRLRLGHVVDFLYFHYQQHGFPAFNVADSAISVGVVILLWDSLNKPAQ
ncbi:MAG TPA: signal peptidase II [Methylophilaceae bacterium]